MRHEATFFHRFRTEIIAASMLLLFLIFYTLHHFPPKFSTLDEEEEKPFLPSQMGRGEVLLIVPASNELAESFQESDFSMAWYNVLTQDFGSFMIALDKDLSEGLLQGINLIVVPRRVARSLSPEQIALIAQSVQSGASLLIEMPTPEWSGLTGIKRKVQSSSAIKRFTDAPSSPLPTPYRDLLLNFPLDSEVLRIDALDDQELPRQDLLLELDGAIAHYYKAYGAGHIFVLAFDLGQAMTALQQGRPSDDFSIEALDEGSVKPSDLVLNERLRNNLIPYADVLKRHVIQALLRMRPMPSLWPFPEAESSALLLTHGIGGQGQDALYMVDYEKEQGIHSTLLVPSQRFDAKTLQALQDEGFQVAAQLVRPPEGVLYESFKLAYLTLFQRALKLSEQVRKLSQRAQSPVRVCKIQGLHWKNSYTKSLRELARAGCTLDLSYGPSQPQEFGYLFGTGFPFMPLNRLGLFVPLYIQPTLFSDSFGISGKESEAIEKLLKESQQKYHQPVVLNFDADSMLKQPHAKMTELWINAIATAKALSMPIRHINAFLLHYHLRKLAKIQSTFRADTRVLEIAILLPKLEDPPQTKPKNQLEHFTLALPSRYLAFPIQAIFLDGQGQDVKSLVRTGDGLQLLLKLTPGEHKVLVQY